MSLKIYPGFNELSLLEAALLSILVDASLKGKSEALTISDLAADTFSPSEEVIKAIHSLGLMGRIGGDPTMPVEIGSLVPGDICINVHVQQRALDYGDKAPSAFEPKHNRSGGEDFEIVAGVTYYAKVWKDPQDDDDKPFGLDIFENHQNHMIQEEWHETLESAWEAFDDFIQERKELADVMEWLKRLYKGDTEVYLDNDTFDLLQNHEDGGEFGEDFFKLQTEDFEGLRWPGLDALGEREGEGPDTFADGDPLAGVDQFTVTLRDGEIVAVVVKDRDELLEITFASDCIGEDGTHVKIASKVSLGDPEILNNWAVDYAQALRDRYVNGQKQTPVG